MQSQSQQKPWQSFRTATCLIPGFRLRECRRHDYCRCRRELSRAVGMDATAQRLLRRQARFVATQLDNALMRIWPSPPINSARSNAFGRSVRTAFRAVSGNASTAVLSIAIPRLQFRRHDVERMIERGDSLLDQRRRVLAHNQRFNRAPARYAKSIDYCCANVVGLISVECRSGPRPLCERRAIVHPELLGQHALGRGFE